MSAICVIFCYFSVLFLFIVQSDTDWLIVLRLMMKVNYVEPTNKLRYVEIQIFRRCAVISQLKRSTVRAVNYEISDSK